MCPQFIVQSVGEATPFQSAYGPMFNVKLAGQLDGQTEPSASINVKELAKAPMVGQTLDVTVTRDQYGAKLKKNPPLQPAPALSPVPAQTAPQPTSPPPAAPIYPPREDPGLRQGSIERQNALTNAVAYCTAKASYMTKADAEKYLTGEHIIRTAIYFASYT